MEITIMVLSGLLAMSELLPMSSLIKSNSNLSLIKNILKSVLLGLKKNDKL